MMQLISPLSEENISIAENLQQESVTLVPLVLSEENVQNLESTQQDSTRSKNLVDYTDSSSENSYTVLDLDNYNYLLQETQFDINPMTFSCSTFPDACTTQNEFEPQPSTSSVEFQQFSYLDSEDSWKPPSSSSTGEETPQQIEEETSVGKRGYRKKRNLPKRLLKKKNRQSAAKKSVKPNPCMNKKCGNSCTYKFSEEDRYTIFENYWGLGNDKRRKDFLLSCVVPKSIGRKRATSDTRKISYNYFLNFNGHNIKICQQYLLKTLDISQMTLRYAVENANKVLNTSQPDKRTPLPHNKSDEEKIMLLKTYIEKLPAVPSHYCRNKSTKLYIPQEFQNISFLYKCYIKYLEEQDLNSLVLSKRVFRSIFKTDFNIGFHLPKKDKCNFCERYKNVQPETRTILEQTLEYQNHIRDKEKCKKLFLDDQNASKTAGSPVLCVSFDLEKVLNTPHGKSVTLYYSRKYAFYNESIYESGTRNGYCYVWGECQGKRGCNEIATIVFKYLTMLDSQGTHRVIYLYADSCAGQNRNRAMLSMIFHFLKTAITITAIKVTYLLPGHTMMPVDSIHSTVESFTRNKVVWAPSEWPTIITNARSNPTSYTVITLNHSDFLDWKSFSQTLLPAKFKIAFNSLRIVNFQKNSPIITLQYGFFEDSEKQELNLDQIMKSRAISASIDRGPRQLYLENLKISSAKYKDLMDLCNKNIIPSRYHEEYLNMRHDGETPDLLNETDEDESNREN